MVANHAVGDGECRVVGDIGVNHKAVGPVLYACPFYVAVLAALREPNVAPLARETVVVAVVAHRGEEDGLLKSASHVEGGAVVYPEAGIVGEIELIAGGETQCLIAVDHGVAYYHMRSRVVPVVAVDDGVWNPEGVDLPAAVDVELVDAAGVGGMVVYGVATVGDDGEFLLLVIEIEDYIGLNEEWRGLVVGVDVGLDEDVDAVVGSNLDVARHATGVAVDVDAETVGAWTFDGDGIDKQRLVVVVVDLHVLCCRECGGEDGVEGDRILRKGEPHRTVGEECLFLDTRREEEQWHY